MAITHEWFIPDQVMGVRWAGIVTEEELTRIDNTILHILNTTQTPHIHFISHELDFLEELSLKAYAQLKAPRHPRFGWYVVIQPRHKAFARMVTQMACTLLQIRFRIVENEAAAWNVFQRIDPLLVPPETTFSDIPS